MSPDDAGPAGLRGVIPALNEAERLGPVVAGALAHLPTVLVIDDGSVDATAEIARAAGADVLRHETNLGKGRSLADGLDRVFADGCAAAVTLDADGQHLPAEIPRFLAAWRDGADIAVGNRMDETDTMPWLRRQTNMFMSWLVGRLARTPVPDSQNGFRLFTAPAWRGVAPHVSTTGFAFESEVLIEAGRRGLRIDAVPISTVYGDEKSRIRPATDTIRFFRMVARKLLRDSSRATPKRTA